MSTTSNFPGDRATLGLALLLSWTCASSSTSVAPDAPREGPRQAVIPARVGGTPRDQHIEVVSATIRRAAEDPELLRQLMPQGNVDPNAMIIDVRTDRPFGDPYRDALIVIVLNGRALTQTIALGQQRLAALISPQELAPRRNTVIVTRLGDRSATTSRKTFVVEVP
jgi:hypothetical protein